VKFHGPKVNAEDLIQRTIISSVAICCCPLHSLQAALQHQCWPQLLLTNMSYNALYEASKLLPVERIAEKLEDFAAAGQDLSRRRFSRSPPPVSSVPSTHWGESELPSPATQLHDQESRELDNSIPSAQFLIQGRDELDRIRSAIDKGLIQQNSFIDLHEAAKANVKYRWIRQGIWNKEWGSQPGETWKHELLDSLPSAGASNPSSDSEISDSGRKRKRQTSYIEEEEGDSVRYAMDFQDRQLSRPCYQFLHQFCKEREWIKMGLSQNGDNQYTGLDPRAYENVKSRWVRDGLWDEDWTCIPGTSWRHERPPKYPAPLEEYRRAAAQKAADAEHAERPPRWYFMAPVQLPKKIIRRFISTNSPELESNPSQIDALKSGTQVIPSQRERSAISRKRGNTAAVTSTHESAVQTKPNTMGREHQERRKRTAAGKPISKSPQIQPTSTKGRRLTEPMPARRPPSAIYEKDPPSIPAARKKETAARASRPRRAAAVKAMQNLKKAARP